MQVERTSKEVIIRLPASVDADDLQEFLHYARYKELTADFKVSQSDVDELAKEINAEYWLRTKTT